jgi:hypothetical protein
MIDVYGTYIMKNSFVLHILNDKPQLAGLTFSISHVEDDMKLT